MKNDQLAIARRILSGETFSDTDIRNTANALRKTEKYGYAAELFIQLIEKHDQANYRDDILHLVQCFYKDVYLPSKIRYGKALEYLNMLGDIAESDDYEVLGVAGAIYKNKWLSDRQDEDLLTSRDYYARGYHQWTGRVKEKADYITSWKDGKSDDQDAGYTAINYAFVLDLIAWNRMSRKGSIKNLTGARIVGFCKEAQDVRQNLLKYFNENNTNYSENTQIDEWVFATIGEAFAGLGNVAKAKEYIGHYMAKKPDTWKTSSTAKQLASLFSVHAELASYLHEAQTLMKEAQQLNDAAKKTKNKEQTEAEEKLIQDIDSLAFLQFSSDQINENGKSCIQVLVSKDETTNSQVSDITLRGKTGLALSGGGFRASLYHIGVLARLAELHVLRHIEVISCVSGGSIIGAYYYLELQKMLEESETGELDEQDYIKLVKRIEKEFLEGIQKNLRLRIFSNIKKNLRIFFDSSFTRTNRLGALYDKYLYQRFKKNKESKPIYMQELMIDVGPNFNIGADNWHRKDKVPNLILNATSLNTGHNFQFTASWMGEPPGAIDNTLDAKPRLRRLYYDEAPEPYKDKIQLSYAVGASSCVPALFEPIVFSELYEGMELRLVDGGVHDNQGIGSLIEQECKVMMISDASGQMTNAEILGGGPSASFVRSDLVLQERVREKQLGDLITRYETGLLNGLVLMHLKRDLEADPIKWHHCEHPTRSIWITHKNDENKDLTSYGIRMDVAEELSKLRTDLDAFTDAEAYALMYAGYKQTEFQFGNSEIARSFIKTEPEKDKNWKFLAIQPYMENAEQSVPLLHRLRVGQNVMFKAFQMHSALRLIPYLLGVLAAAALSYWLYYHWSDEHTFSKTLPNSVIGLAIGGLVADQLLGFGISKVYNYRGFIIRAGVLCVFAVLASVVSWIFILALHPWYLYFGTIASLNRADKLLRFWKRVKAFTGMSGSPLGG
jgi:predicted acylesterase/phospholipase RssA